MTFNSSCSFAGVANMLEFLGYDAEDYEIAKGMKLPYLFLKKNDSYLSGPMLQTKEYFNLYLNPIGFEMNERKVSSKNLIMFLNGHVPSMIGVKLEADASSKHAIIFVGYENNKLKFINNKRVDSCEPDYYLWSEEELLNKVDTTLIVGNIKKCKKKNVNLQSYFKKSLSYLSDFEEDLKNIINKEHTKNQIFDLKDKIFRSILLDNITALKFTSEDKLVRKFELIQKQFLKTIRSDFITVKLNDFIDTELLLSAIADWRGLINDNIKHTTV